ncbi:MAG: zinc dependent phospholipase C family protein [Defluviitaleaceae bacterium]|nr:zinc dependent phospholipase C family protein [Defluviitaleaceae bacterium]
MAGTVTHIAIAEKIYSIVGSDKISNLADFYNGNLAPDAIHAKKGYQRIDKKRSHLTEDIPNSEIINPAKTKLFYDRVNAFINNYYLSSDNENDLYLGYITHLLADALFNMTVRENIVKRASADGINQHEAEFAQIITKDIINVDYLLVSKYPFIQNPVEILERKWDYEIKDFVGKDEINGSKWWVIDSFFKNPPEPQPLKYYSYEEAVDFIESAVDNIVYKLRGNDEIIRIL